ncbi:MAG: hypothetical protein B7Y41_04575 [Hydrogenophilales bacterium 28-61-23]|nr:MAG: hypothetical protein B7Y41_04575 [Hydrogenophilales bacterium 28-61-23]
MKHTQRIALLLAGCAFCLTTTASQAAVTITPGNASAVPGGQAMPTLTFSFDAPYDFTSLTLLVDYDADLMTFNKAQSSISINGVQQDFSALLSNPDFFSLVNDDVGSYSLSALFGDGHYAIPAGSMVMNSVFDLTPGFHAGMSTAVHIYGSMTSTAADVDPFPEDVFDVAASVTAVPEPATWLMMLGGLGLVVVQRMLGHARNDSGYTWN